MNYLAHLFLSCSDESLLIGNFLTDFLKKQETDALPEKYHVGVAFHRHIDTFTDQHPSVLSGVRLLQPYHSKYASVVVDIFYDYFLIQNWEKYTQESFTGFRERVYQILLDHLKEMPAKIQPRVIHMVDGDWLESYGNVPGVLYAVDRLSKRASRPELLANAKESLENEKARLNTSFLDFFPDVMDATQQFCF